MGYKVAVVGATGAVGGEMLNILAERDFPADQVVALASRASAGREVSFGENDVLKVQALESFDFEGIGDNVPRRPERENHPYVSHPVEDIRAALACLRTAGCDRFVLVGLCSGAYHVFKAGLELRDVGDLERLRAPEVLARIPLEERPLDWRHRPHVIRYLRAWADLLEERAARHASETAAEISGVHLRADALSRAS